jgi:hypothetical protein
MNCDECKDLLGVFLENDLAENQASGIRAHLAVCGDCAVVCEDLAALVDVCADEAAVDLVPASSKAMWCRINNIIESERAVEIPPPLAPQRRFWQFSLTQLVTVIGCIAVISSVVTFIAIRSYTRAPGDDLTTRADVQQTAIEKLLSRAGLIESPQQARERRLKEREAAIDYWTARVEARRHQWDNVTREAFDRNLKSIDESVSEYTSILQQDPDDELSGEMLDAVLNDKMNLLRDFSDL